MSTWLPVTDEVRKKADKILQEELREKEQYIQEKRGGSISDENVQFLADGVFKVRTDIDSIIRRLTFKRWDSSVLTDEQVLNLFFSNPKIESHLQEYDELIEAMVSQINPTSDYYTGEYTEDEIEDNYWWWDFETEEDYRNFWLENMRYWLSMEFEEEDHINSYEEILKEMISFEGYNEFSEQDHIKLGEEQNNNGQYELAIRSYTKALEINQNNDDTYWKRSDAKYTLGKRQEAIDDLKKAIKINKKNPIYGTRLASINEDLADLDDA